MAKHSSIGPSALHRLLACPGSHALSAGRKKEPPSIYAATGSVAHALAEGYLKDGTPPLKSLGKTIVFEKHDVLVDQEMIDGIGLYTEYVETILKHPAFKTGWVEEKVTLNDLWGTGLPPEDLFGTVDFGAHVSHDLHVVDFKYGRGAVSPKDNPQAMAYALGLYFHIRKNQAGTSYPTAVHLHIVQPRDPAGDVVKTWSLSILDLMIWGTETLKKGIEALFIIGAELNAGDWCIFCPSKANCPELAKTALASAQVEFGEDAIEPISLSNSQVSEYLGKLDTIQTWIKAIKDEAKTRAEDGQEIPGWKLVAATARRRWMENADILTIAKGLAPLVDVTVTSLKSPAALSKEAPDVYQALEDAGVVSRISSGCSLVPVSDKRMALGKNKPDTDFDKI